MRATAQLAFITRFALIVAVLFSAGCSSLPNAELGMSETIATSSAGNAVTPAAASDGSRLERGDKLRVVVFNEPQLSGEFLVDTTGTIAFPLVGEVPVAGLNAREVEKRLVERLTGRYLVNPRVSVEIANQRPIYILGEVGKAGEYPYRPGLNVVSAIALAGGFSPRAATSNVVIRRANEAQAKQYPVQPNVAVFPGDMITVQERLF
jgi:polysaccharide export outer membrane protein